MKALTLWQPWASLVAAGRTFDEVLAAIDRALTQLDKEGS